MFRIKLKKMVHNTLTDDDLDYLTKQTEGLSGSDISTLVNEANIQPIKEAQSTKYFIPIQVDNEMKYAPSTKDTV